MASCNNDKLKAFLTKPKLRRRRRLDEIQEAEHQADNKFVGKIFFEARVLNIPIQTEPILVTGGSEIYEFFTYVRLFDKDDPVADPIDAADSARAIQQILSLPVALVESTKNIKVGDIVTVRLNSPAQQGAYEFYSIVNKVATDKEYADKLATKLDNGSGQTRGAFDNLSRGDQIQAAIAELRNNFQPEERTLAVNDETVTNGTLTDTGFDFLLNADGNKVNSVGFVYDNNEILIDFRSTDANGGIAFAKSNNGENMAEQFRNLCRAYRQASKDNNWPGPKYIIINSCFRSYEKQLYLEATQPELSAQPGTSNHGWGMAFDWGNGVVRVRDLVGQVHHTWMVQNAPAFGFTSTLEITGEPWHFEVTNEAAFYKN